MSDEKNVGTLAACHLPKILGETLVIRRSVEGVNKRGKPKKHPLYLWHSNLGAIFFNSEAGQDFLLENGVFKGAPKPAADPKPAPASDPKPAPAADPKPAPASDPKPAPVVKRRSVDADLWGEK